MESTTLSAGRLKRPGGRTAEVTERVHRAVLELLVEGGIRACTFANVAEKAGVERSTLYRRFPDRWATIVDAFMAKGAADLVPELSGSFAGDLKSALIRIRNMLETPVGPALMVAAAEFRAAGFSHGQFARRMAQLDPMFDAAIARGELDAGVDRESLFALAAGAINFKAFLISKPVDDAWIDEIVANMCKLYCIHPVKAFSR